MCLKADHMKSIHFKFDPSTHKQPHSTIIEDQMVININGHKIVSYFFKFYNLLKFFVDLKKINLGIEKNYINYRSWN